MRLQDPHNLENRDLSQFDYIKRDLKNEDDVVKADEINVKAIGGAGKVLAELAKSSSGKPVSCPRVR